MKTVHVKLTDSAYDIFISNNDFKFEKINKILQSRKIMIVSNVVVAPIYLDDACHQIEKITQHKVFTYILKDGEQYKNMLSWSSIIDALADNNFNRSDLLISLGGGVVCDMTGFAAASWMRGIDFVQIPTSLLAQVDASVGGKTGINHPKGKNLIGAFYQPKAVLINTSTIKTLTSKEFKSGLGEVLKYGFINQEKFIKWFSVNSQQILVQDLHTLAELIAQCCQFKVDIVQQDEKESGIRALLNLGHTFAHAIETITDYKDYSHGEAVAIGMVMAAELSVILKVCDSNLRNELEKHLQDFQLLTMLPSTIDANDLLALMRLDKKVINNNHRLILMRSLGDAFIHNNVCEKNILQAITNCQY